MSVLNPLEKLELDKLQATIQDKKDPDKTGPLADVTAFIHGFVDHTLYLADKHEGITTEAALTIAENHLKTIGGGEVDPVSSIAMELGFAALIDKARLARGEEPHLGVTFLKAKVAALFKVAAEHLFGDKHHHHQETHAAATKVIDETQSTAPKAVDPLTAYKGAVGKELSDGKSAMEAHFKAGLATIDNIVATHPGASAALIAGLTEAAIKKAGQKNGHNTKGQYDAFITAGLLAYAVEAHNRKYPQHKIGALGYISRLVVAELGIEVVHLASNKFEQPYRDLSKTKGVAVKDPAPV